MAIKREYKLCVKSETKQKEWEKEKVIRRELKKKIAYKSC